MQRRVTILAALGLSLSTLVPSATATHEPIQWWDVPQTNPTDQAIAISQLRYHEPGEADHAVLARDDTFADALAGSALTAWGPLLYTPTDHLDEDVGAELARVLEPGDTVYLLGGVNALSDAVAAAVEDLGLTPRRLAGESRVHTSLAIAEEVHDLSADDPRPGGWPTRDYVAIARAWGPVDSPTAAWADAIAFGPIAAFERRPILLTTTDALHPAVDEWLDRWVAEPDRGRSDIEILGGEAAVSEAAEAALPGSTGDHNVWVRRHAGRDRVETARRMAHHGASKFGARGYYLIDGRSPTGWAHGLAVAGLGALFDVRVLLLDRGGLPWMTGEVIGDCGSRGDALRFGQAVVVADQGDIPADTLEIIDELQAGDCTRQPLRGDPEDHRFVWTYGGRPGRFNPCETQRFVINPVDGPPSAIEDTLAAFAIASEATGIDFVYEGVTDERASFERDPYLPGRYGDRWAPIIVDWQQPDEHNRLGPGASGRGGPLARDGVYVSGVVTLNAKTATVYAPGFGERHTIGGVLLHEITHVVGLDHPPHNSGQLMSYYNEYSSPARYETGDLTGLAELGAARGCLTSPRPG